MQGLTALCRRRCAPYPHHHHHHTAPLLNSYTYSAYPSHISTPPLAVATNLLVPSFGRLAAGAVEQAASSDGDHQRDDPQDGTSRSARWIRPPDSNGRADEDDEQDGRDHSHYLDAVVGAAAIILLFHHCMRGGCVRGKQDLMCVYVCM